MLNLFVLIILQKFEECYISKINPVSYMKNERSFKIAWSQYCEKKGSNRIKITKIIEFFKHLGPPLGCSKSDSFLQAGKKLLRMNIIWYDYFLYSLYN